MVVETDFVRMQQVDKGLSRRRSSEEAAEVEAKKRCLLAMESQKSATPSGEPPTPQPTPAPGTSRPANPWGPIFQNAQHFKEMHIC